jgi:uncharacterized protein (DUF1786 family)
MSLNNDTHSSVFKFLGLRGKVNPMQILTVDIGTGTQDIFLYDSELDIENNVKLILPSPTMIIFKKINAATKARQPILLTGTIMGGGPSQWAAEEHIKSGLPVFATQAAAKSFNDDIDEINKLGITVISEDEAKKIEKKDGYTKIEMRDFDFSALSSTFETYGISLQTLTAIAVAVFDHGNSPPGIRTGSSALIISKNKSGRKTH